MLRPYVRFGLCRILYVPGARARARASFFWPMRPILAIALLVLLAAPAAGQDAPEPLPPRTDAPVDTLVAPVDPGVRRDIRWLRTIYDTGSPVLARTLSVVDATSYPAFVAIPAGYAAHALVRNGSYRPALRALLAEGAAGAFVTVAKGRLRRDRPYVADTTIYARVYGRRVHFIGKRSYSLPSGHAALGFAGATSVALTDGRPGVVAASYAWATAVALARVYEGVHYPSDVIAGAAVGFLAGATAHVLLPDRRRADTPEGGVPLVNLRLQF